MGALLARIWEGFVGRGAGPLAFRLIVQPSIAVALGAWAGLDDARHARPAYLWTVLFHRPQRRELLQRGWADIGKLFALSLLLDALYQVVILQWVYVGQALVVAIVLAVIPYVTVRSVIGRVARRRRPTGTSPATPRPAGRAR